MYDQMKSITSMWNPRGRMWAAKASETYKYEPKDNMFADICIE